MTLPWYPRNMGEYARDTKSLTLLEHGAYNMLLDEYYSSGAIACNGSDNSNAEAMLPDMLDHSRIYIICRALKQEEQKAVDHVLSKFFKMKKGHYRHAKCDQVIEEQEQKHANRVRAGKSNGKAKQEHCSSNTGQIKTKTKIKNQIETYDIFMFVKDDGLREAKRAAPDWDIKYLGGIFSKAIVDGTLEIPSHPVKAFSAWCASFTDGKSP